MKIRIDTREQEGTFYFKAYADVETIIEKVNEGDYNVPGFEHIVTVDRKRTPSELSMNIGKDAKRLQKEFERMKNIQFCYFVCCFPYIRLEQFPENSGIPKSKWKYLKISGAYIRKRIKEIEEEYPNIKFIFCNNETEAEDITYQILKEHTSGK